MTLAPRPSDAVDPLVEPQPVREIDRPAWFTLMAPGWMPPAEQVTQALGFCFTAAGMVVLVSPEDQRWTLPGGTIEPGETIEQALIREIEEEACATIITYEYLASQHVADPHHPDGPASYYQTRWWAHVSLSPWQPRHEMTNRRLVAPNRVLSTLCWADKTIAARLLDQALTVNQRHAAG